MKNRIANIILAIALLLTLCLILDALAADNHYRKRRRYRGESHKLDDDNGLHDGNDHLKPIANQAYTATCGECHFAYPPQLMPSASWLQILNRLEDHFGEEIEIDPDTKKNISDYVKINGAENASAKISVKIMRCLGDRVPARITDIPYIRKKHHELDPAVFKRKSIGSPANCPACHVTAEKGFYDEDSVKIPD